MPYSNWYPTQPDNVGYACVSMIYGPSYQWLDEPCTSVHCSVCEVDLI